MQTLLLVDANRAAPVQMDLFVSTVFVAIATLIFFGGGLNNSFGVWAHAMQPWDSPFILFYFAYWCIVEAGVAMGW